MKAKTIIAALSIAAAAFSASAQEAVFFDTSEPATPFGVGVRVGVNSSNATNSSKLLSSNLDSWGTGVDLGAVFDINLRDYLTIQPGIFLDVKNNKYCHSTTVYDPQLSALHIVSNEGHTRHTTFTIPVLASIRFNFADNIRWYADCGPYLQFGLGGHDEGDYTEVSNVGSVSAMYQPYKNGYYDIRRKFDWGLKVGTAMRLYDHYYVGIHYEAGFCRVYKQKEMGGHNKAWTFSIGYDF